MGDDLVPGRDRAGGARPARRGVARRARRRRDRPHRGAGPDAQRRRHPPLRAGPRRRPANAPDGPFRGVPFLIKDLHCTTAGEPAHRGQRVPQERRLPRDASRRHLAARFAGRGLRQSRSHEHPRARARPDHGTGRLGRDAQPVGLVADARRVERRFGGGGRRRASSPSRTRATVAAPSASPRRRAGSSGSSRRVGASPSGPIGGELFRILSVQFGLTRTVRDCAALLDVAAGPEPGDPIVAPAGAGSVRGAGRRRSGPSARRAPHPHAEPARRRRPRVRRRRRGRGRTARSRSGTTSSRPTARSSISTSS